MDEREHQEQAMRLLNLVIQTMYVIGYFIIGGFL
jgi:hypothetical protein